MHSSRFQRVFNRDLQRFGCLSWWLLFRLLPALVLSAVSLLVLSASQARAEAAIQEVKTGELLYRAEGGGWSSRAARRVSSNVEARSRTPRPASGL